MSRLILTLGACALLVFTAGEARSQLRDVVLSLASPEMLAFWMRTISAIPLPAMSEAATQVSSGFHGEVTM